MNAMSSARMTEAEPDNVTAMRGGHMTEAQYDKERAKIAPTKREAQAVAGVRWEQQLAALFYRSGWNTVQLAAKEDKSKTQIKRLLIFGRFLASAPIGAEGEIVPNNLSEGRFREYWDLTSHLGGSGGSGGNEHIRFREITRLMQKDLKLGNSERALPRGVGSKIREQFADGKWHPIEKVTKEIGAEGNIGAVLRHLTQHPVAYGMRTERKQVGTSFHYRFFKQEKTVSVDELKEKLTPIIKELMIQGRANMATISPAGVLANAGRLQKLLDEWMDDDE
jgi:hypothetical protein